MNCSYDNGRGGNCLELRVRLSLRWGDNRGGLEQGVKGHVSKMLQGGGYGGVPVVSFGVERVAEWLRRWSQDQGVWGSIPEAPVMRKS